METAAAFLTGVDAVCVFLAADFFETAFLAGCLAGSTAAAAAAVAASVTTTSVFFFFCDSSSSAKNASNKSSPIPANKEVKQAKKC